MPGERRPVPGEVHARDDQGERDVAHRRAGQRRAPLAIRADAERERQPPARDRVGGVEVQVLDAIGALRLAIQARARIGGRHDEPQRLVARPDLIQILHEPAIAPAALQVVLHAAGVREVVRVDRSGLLRARREPAARAAERLSEDEVLPRLRIRAADRVLGPAGAVRRVFAGDEQVRREHAIVFDLQQPVRPSRRKEVFLLVPRRRRRVDQDAAVGRRSAHLVGVALVIQHAHHVLLRRLPLALERVLLEPRPIDVLARRAEDPHVLRRVRAIEPRLVLRDRPAEIDVHVRDLLVVVRRVGRHAARGERRRHVRRLELVVREVAVCAALELVRAALEDQVVADGCLMSFPAVEICT